MQFCILGPLAVLGPDGDPVDVRGVKLRTLLTVLVLRAGQKVSNDQLFDVLWGDSPPAGTDNALQTHISKLRRLLEPGMLVTHDGAYSLELTTSTVDALEFARLLAAGRDELAAARPDRALPLLRAALGWWRGTALSDIDHELATPERVRLEESQLGAREDLLDAALASGDHDSVVAEAEAALVQHPLRERLWALLMLALYRSGRQSDALRAFQRARDVLAEQLGLDPGPELRALERKILDQDIALAARGSAPRVPISRSNMHPSLSNFVGRTGELAAISSLIRERRIVTITGPGGVGKTRLAIEAALGSAAHWPDGTWLVDLGTENGERAVDRVFLHSFGPRLGHTEGDTLAWLTAGLADTALLVVIDNCEHVLDQIVPLTESLLRACPGVHVLATSREPLGCAGERVVRLEPLPLDDAIVLFTTRAEDSSADMHASEDTANAVHAICTKLDRLPLAIELTAARTRVFSVTQLATLLDQRSSLASTDSASRLPRQQTLDATVDWSYELLFEAERRLLMRLAVFVGGFTLDAAIAVCADADLPAAEVELMVARLVDKSLVNPTPSTQATTRFRLLRPVAEFAAHRLHAAGGTTMMRARHMRWLLDLTSSLSVDLRGAGALERAGELDDELPNIASAASWAITDGDSTGGLQLAVNLGWYAFLSANIGDDEATILASMARAVDAPADLLCRATMWAALLSIGHTDRRTWAMDAIDVARTAAGSGRVGSARADPVRGARARLSQEEAVEMTMSSISEARSTADTGLQMEALAVGALHLGAIGRSPRMVSELTSELRELAERADDSWHVALATGLAGLAAYADGELDAAIGLIRTCIDAMQHLGDIGTAAMFQVSLAEVAELRGDLPIAIEAMTAAYAVGSAGRFRSSIILCSVLCWLTARNGETARSLEFGRDALAAVRRPFNPVIRAQALFALGTAQHGAGLLDESATHLSEALTIHERIGMTRESAMDHRQLGLLALDRGDIHGAEVHHRRSVHLTLDVGLPWTIMLAVGGLATASAAAGRCEPAIMLTAIADSIGEQSGYQLTEIERRERGRVVDTCVAALGVEAVDRALAAGRTLGIAGLGGIAGLTDG